jgi:hypothetical protein
VVRRAWGVLTVGAGGGDRALALGRGGQGAAHRGSGDARPGIGRSNGRTLTLDAAMVTCILRI